LLQKSGRRSGSFLKDLQVGAAGLGLHVEIINAGTDADIDTAFAKLPQQPVPALLVSTDAFLFSRHEQIARLATRYRVPAMFDNREYAADFYNVLQLAGVYPGRVLRGEKPADFASVAVHKI